ncbi:MAG: methyltransferase [Muribaculaceae bacterium]|nr:methyltransferase [Muribaculaceae bacterium]
MAREKIFKFKQFCLLNDKTAMKVGTDGVLLGAWCDVAGAQRILDVGTGCGLIALMVAQRKPDATIMAIDIDCDAVEEAMVNITNSPWGDRVEASVADFNGYFAQEPFDLIVSNPPFFTENVMAPDYSRNMARHSVTLTMEQLIDKSKLLLADDGILAFISPVEQEMSIRRCLVKTGMSIKRLARVVPVEESAPKRLMWEFVKSSVKTIEEQIIIKLANGAYSKQYITLTRDFYLNL